MTWSELGLVSSRGCVGASAILSATSGENRGNSAIKADFPHSTQVKTGPRCEREQYGTSDNFKEPQLGKYSVNA